jgi:2-amino-4-hydroxy-6-hydroxymethyldihydropteridine diphosphokinase
MPDLAFIGLGSNQGDSRALVTRAIKRLRQFSAGPLLKSSLWKTEPVDCPPGTRPFVNAVVGLRPRPGETPGSLLALLQGLEREFGRPAAHGHHAPRTLDLDLIAFGSMVCLGLELVLPHPRAHERRFVLAPLNEIAPDFVLPGQDKTVRELLAALPEKPAAVRNPWIEKSLCL